MKINIGGISYKEKNSIKNVEQIEYKLHELEEILEIRQLGASISCDQLSFLKENVFLSKNISKVIELLEELANLCPSAEFALVNSLYEKKVWEDLYKKEKSLALLNFFPFLGNITSFFIYRSYDYRSKRFLPVDDSFYLNIPAIKNRKLEEGSISVRLVKDFDDYEEFIQTTEKAAKYFINYLKEKELFGRLDINNWRTVNRDLLIEKGFHLPEWD